MMNITLVRILPFVVVGVGVVVHLLVEDVGGCICFSLCFLEQKFLVC